MAAQLKEKREKESEARRKENGTARDAPVEGGAAIKAAAESEGKEEKVGASALPCGWSQNQSETAIEGNEGITFRPKEVCGANKKCKNILSKNMIQAHRRNGRWLRSLSGIS